MGCVVIRISTERRGRCMDFVCPWVTVRVWLRGLWVSRCYLLCFFRPTYRRSPHRPEQDASFQLFSAFGWSGIKSSTPDTIPVTLDACFHASCVSIFNLSSLCHLCSLPSRFQKARGNVLPPGTTGTAPGQSTFRDATAWPTSWRSVRPTFPRPWLLPTRTAHGHA